MVGILDCHKMLDCICYHNVNCAVGMGTVMYASNEAISE